MNTISTLTRSIARDAFGTCRPTASDDEHLVAAVSWLTRSHDATGRTGSAAYYSLLTGWAGPYPETTGYIVPTLYDYASVTEDNEAAARASQMAEWLLETQLDCGGFPAGVDPGPTAEPSVFNTGQILFGLIRAFRETGRQRYLEAATEAADWLVDVQADSGCWDSYDYRGETHSYCSRVAWALLEVDAVADAGDEYREAAGDFVSWVLEQQHSNGWFDLAGFSPGETPFLHTIAYTLRGLLEAGILLDDSAAVAAVRKSAQELRALHEVDGVLSGEYDHHWDGSNYYCLTGNAQTALVWYRLASHDSDRSYDQAITETTDFLKQMHEIRGPAGVYGGMRGSHPVWGRYLRLRYPNWAVKFFVDLLLYPQR